MKHTKKGVKRDRNLSSHHIRPKSRGGKRSLKNIAIISKSEHQHYHALFYNQIPEEIVKTLVNYYWNGQWEHVKKAQENEGIETKEIRYCLEDRVTDIRETEDEKFVANTLSGLEVYVRPDEYKFEKECGGLDYFLLRNRL